MKYFILTVLLLLTLDLKGQNTDCSTATPVCATTFFTGNSSGHGTEEIDNTAAEGCLLFGENQSAWYRINVTAAGTLSFIIDPHGTSDYDFALYRTTDCSSLGAPVRCSWAATSFICLFIGGPACNTGLDPFSTDNSESAGGDGFVSTLTVFAGETYYLLVDNFTADFQGYEIDFSATTADLSCTPLPLNVLNFQGEEIGINSAAFTLVTSNEYNVKYQILQKSLHAFDNFANIDTLRGKNKSYNQYTFTDNKFEKSAYYRVKSVDNDGQVSYSNTLFLGHSQAKDYLAKPNPATETLITPNVDYTIMSTTGSIVQQGSSQQTINISTWSQGLYFVKTQYGSQKIIVK